MRILLSSTSYSHSRQAKTVYDVFGEIGGYHDITFTLGFAYLFNIYNTTALIKHMTSSEEVDTSPKTKKNSKNKLISLSERLKSKNTRLQKLELVELM